MKISETRHLKSIVDQFETEDYFVSVIEHTDLTLKAVIKNCFPNGSCSLQFARRTIARVAAVIKKMHDQKVIHCDLRQETVCMRVSNTESCGYAVSRPIGLDYAICLKPKQKFVQGSI